LVSSIESLANYPGLNLLSFTHVPMMPDLYLPFDKCETLELTPMDEAAKKQLI
jgi:hypothetical protein